MRIQTSDPDISGIYNRIKRGLIDLQPDFQRGEVWNTTKKQRLIDSILRGWHIPPVHLISDPITDKLEVLDGQQRLVSIRDFINGNFSINGSLEPKDDDIAKLNGLYWDDLPDAYQVKIELFTIRFLTITDYKIGEPGELFHRLNHPTSLTSAEQRNAFFGESRQQVKSVAAKMLSLGYDRTSIGFTNSRMAYDDVVAKLLLTIDQGTLNKKITSSIITDKYRSDTGFNKEDVVRVENTLNKFASSLEMIDVSLRLNKASFHSWILFVDNLIEHNISTDTLADFIEEFETSRNNEELDLFSHPKFKATSHGLEQAQQIFTDRSTSRVADVSSVLLRDIVLHGLFFVFSDFKSDNMLINKLTQSFSFLLNRGTINDEELLSIAKELNWRRS
jgi:hypothetical protein